MDGLQLGQSPPGFRSGFASFIGRPNVGKSTLLNQIMRAKVSIISERPQTTRNAVRGVLTTEAAQAVFIDTPGFHKPRTALGQKLNAVVHVTLAEVDVVVFVVDAADGVGSGDAFLAHQLHNVRTPVLVVLNKTDLVAEQALERQMVAVRALGSFEEILPVSAKSGAGVADLVRLVTSRLPEGPLFYPPDQVTDQPESVLVAEIVREKALRLTRDEVPHSIAVVVEEMREAEEEGRLEVDVIVYVERDSQKGILIGHRGGMLKQIGTEARREISALLGSRVHLDLRVKVKRDWQRQPGLVERFGYGRQ
ncbi:MAG TPA: GTPase Era [Actinomycetota bacterium]|nr:GTPase Era [Actinomycetota bacterium]